MLKKSILCAMLIMVLASFASAGFYNYWPGELPWNTGDWTLDKSANTVNWDGRYYATSMWGADKDIKFGSKLPAPLDPAYGRGGLTWEAPEGEVITHVYLKNFRIGYLPSFKAAIFTGDRGQSVDDMDILWEKECVSSPDWTSEWLNFDIAETENVTALSLGFNDMRSDASSATIWYAVQITTADVPEPASMLLLGVGSLVFCLNKRCKKA